MKKGSYNRDIFHGGDLDAAKAAFGHDDPPWLDLSTGINPNPYPLPQIAQHAWTRLPSSSLELALYKAAKSYYGAADDMPIIAASGTQALIQRLPSLIDISAVAIVTPTYKEHQTCWSRAGHRVVEISNLEDLPDACRHCIVVSPNNPTGRDYTPHALSAAAQVLKQRGGYLIVDEAFKDVASTDSMGTNAADTNILILKSFGKFFGLAGLRLGFAMGDPHLISKLRDALGPWAVSGVAMEVGIAAFSDTSWIKKTRAQLAANRLRLCEMLTHAGFQIQGGTDLFTFAHHHQAAHIFGALCEQHILTRPFEFDPHKLRFGHPANEHEWQRLNAALKSI